jgi:hypothetical protein
MKGSGDAEGFSEEDPEFLRWEANYLLSRREWDDTAIWQAPVLALTAQAFLLTIALGGSESRAARVVASVLALLTALTSLYMMERKRRDIDLIEAGINLITKQLHDRQLAFTMEQRAKRVSEGIPNLLPWSAPGVWRWALLIFAAADIAILTVVIVHPSFIGSQMC